MDEIIKQIEEAKALLLDIETYCFENKRSKYSELKTDITDILRSKLEDLDDFKYINTEEDTKTLLSDIMAKLNGYMQALKTIDDIKFVDDENGNVNIVSDEKVKLDTGNYEAMELATTEDDDIIEMVNNELGTTNTDIEMPTVSEQPVEQVTAPIDFTSEPVESENNFTSEFSAIDDFLNNQINDASLRVA